MEPGFRTLDSPPQGVLHNKRRTEMAEKQYYDGNDNIPSYGYDGNDKTPSYGYDGNDKTPSYGYDMRNEEESTPRHTASPSLMGQRWWEAPSSKEESTPLSLWDWFRKLRANKIKKPKSSIEKGNATNFCVPFFLFQPPLDLRILSNILSRSVPSLGEPRNLPSSSYIGTFQ